MLESTREESGILFDRTLLIFVYKKERPLERTFCGDGQQFFVEWEVRGECSHTVVGFGTGAA